MNAWLVKFRINKEALLNLPEDGLGNSLVGGRPEEPGTVDAEGEDLPPGDLIHGR